MDKNMSQSETVFQEIKPTFWRLSKIYWSSSWRSILVLFPVLFSIFLYWGYSENGIHQAQEIVDQFMNISLSLHYASWLIFLYFLDCFIFRLIIGKSYADFNLSFIPKLDPKMPGYWPTIFYVSWAYFWRISLVMAGFNLLANVFPSLFKITSFSFFCTLLEIFMDILLLRFVVNQQYGPVRLSLLKRESDA